MITNKELKLIGFPLVEKELNDVLNKFGINTRLRLVHFLAQLAHESNDLKVLQENLNYSSKGLLNTFPRYFKNIGIADLYQRKPEKIANRVYANRGGNGSENSGDGWKYRGRGPIQITLKNNYIELSKATGKDYVNNPDLLLSIDNGLEAAGWFWKENGINRFADKNDIFNVSRLINNPSAKTSNGINGYQDRLNKLNKINALI